MVRRMLYGGALMCMAVLLYFILSSCEKDTGITYNTFEIARTAEGLYVLRPDALAERLCGAGDYIIRHSGDKASAFLYTVTGKELYYISRDAQSLLSDGVEHAEVSADGTAAAYFTGGAYPYSLYLYDREAGQPVPICSDAEVDGELGACVALSPTGGGVGYIKRFGEGYSGWLFRDGEEKELGERIYPVLVGENGSVTYIREPEPPSARLCVFDGQEYELGKLDLLTYVKDYPEYSNTVSIITDKNNEDVADILAENKERALYSRNDGVRKISQNDYMKLFDGLDDDMVIFADSSVNIKFMKRGWKNQGGAPQPEIILIEDIVLNKFDGFLDDLLWGNKKINFDEAVRYETDISYDGFFNTFTVDKKSIYHINAEKELVDSSVRDGKVISEKIVENAGHFWMSDAGNIYYKNSGGALIHRSGKKERTVAAGALDVLLTKDGKYAVFTAKDDNPYGDALYSAENGRNKRLLDTGVADIRPLDGAVLYYKNEDGMLSAYITSGKGKGEKVLDSIDIRYIMSMKPYSGY